MFSEVLHGFILKAGAVVTALSCIFPCQAARKEIGIQLYSVRSILNARNYPENQARVFKSLAKMGYSFVEVANYGNGKFYGVSPEQFRVDVEAAGPVWRFLGKKGLPDVDFPGDYDRSAIGPYVAYYHRPLGHGIADVDWQWMLEFADAHIKGDK